MQIDQATVQRERRRQELQRLWCDHRSRTKVLSLFHEALPNGQSPTAGMSVFDVILEWEFSDQAGQEDYEA